MTIFPFKIPQLGEGLVGARVVTLFKSAGDSIGRDEPLLEIETDKAVMSLESPVAGVVERWLVNVEDDAEIGAVVCQIRTAGAGKETPAPAVRGDVPAENPFSNGNGSIHKSVDSDHLVSGNGSANGSTNGAHHISGDENANGNGQANGNGNVNGHVDGNNIINDYTNGNGSVTRAPEPNAIRNGQVSPRLRAKALAQGVSTPDLEQWSREENGRLSEETLDAHLQRQTEEVASGEPFLERTLSARQTRLAAHLQRAWQGVVPAILEIEVSWELIEREVEARRTKQARPTPLHIITWAVVGAMREHPRFCSTWKGGGLLREWKHVNVGFAVALDADELAVATVTRAETMDFEGFSVATRASIASVRAGEKPHGEAQFVISDLSRAGILSAIPLVVPPATATLFVGTPFEAPQKTEDGGLRWEKRARLVLSCDHRLINGAGAAKFLGALQALLSQGS